MTEQGGQDGVGKDQTGSLTECFNTNGLWPGGDAAHISIHQLLVKEVVRVAVFTIFGIKLPKYVLAPNGHQVYATVWNPQRSPELGQLAERDSLPITILPIDVDSDESIKAVVVQILAQTGHIDVLVNNAGIAPMGSVEELPAATFRDVMETNYFGTLRCIQAVMPNRHERQAGCIINISSVAGKLYSPFSGAYCASKAAVKAMSECLASELQPFSIRVVLVEPNRPHKYAPYKAPNPSRMNR